MNEIKPTIIAVLRNKAQIYVGESRFHGEPVFMAESKRENFIYELRGDATTSDHYAALVNEFGDAISKPEPDAKLINSNEFNTEGQIIEPWMVEWLRLNQVPF